MRQAFLPYRESVRSCHSSFSNYFGVLSEGDDVVSAILSAPPVENRLR